MKVENRLVVFYIVIAQSFWVSVKSCETTELRIVPSPDRCAEECGMFEVAVKCTNTGCYKPQRWSCVWKCHKEPPVETQVRKCCPGYRNTSKGICVDIDECADDGLAAGCYGCVNTPGSYRCVCERGFRPSPDNNEICDDIDECSTGKAQCSGACINTIGSFFCTCPQGFHLGADNRTCEDVDECLTGQSKCSDVCLNTYGSYQCGCTPGFEISVENGVKCVDIDECHPSSSRKCSHDCRNTNGSFYCSCPEHMAMAKDLRNCIDYGKEDRCSLVIAFSSLAIAVMAAIFVSDKIKRYRRRQARYKQQVQTLMKRSPALCPKADSLEDHSLKRNGNATHQHPRLLCLNPPSSTSQAASCTLSAGPTNSVETDSLNQPPTTQNSITIYVEKPDDHLTEISSETTKTPVASRTPWRWFKRPFS